VRPQDIALIRQTTLENVRCWDLVLFRHENYLFVHRIVKKQGTLEAVQLLSKGDAHPTMDGILEEQELLGRVVRIYREGRRIDLDTPGQLALGAFISQLSLHNRFGIPWQNSLPSRHGHPADCSTRFTFQSRRFAEIRNSSLNLP
jgi:hypothetical protein